jgi:hypothetical protein
MGMLTVAMLKKHTETVIRLPALSEAEGTDVEIRCRWIGREEYVNLMPPAPPGSDTWKREDVAEKAEAWFHSLPADVQQRREAQARDVLYAVVALAAIEPALTLAEARAMGSDAETAAVAILRASGILKPAPVEPKADAAPVAEPAELVAA